MNELMSMAEIESQFKSEWVLIEDPETTDSLEVKSGRVRWRCKDRNEFYKKALQLKPKHSAILYTGPVVPEGTAVIL